METTEFKEISKDQISQARELVTTLIKLLGVELEIADKISKGRIVLNVKASEPGRLIGRRGSALEHLVLIVNKFLKSHNIEFPKVIINVEGFEKREKPVRQKRERNDNNKRRDNKRERRPREEKAEQTVKTDAPQAEKTEAKKDDAPQVEKTEAKKEAAPIKVPKIDTPVAKDEKPAAPKAEKTEVKKSEAPKAEKAEVKNAEAPKAEAKKEAPAKPKQENSKKPVSKLQKQCRNASKEVKRWGEPVLLPAMPEAECFKAVDLLKNDKELVAVIDDKNYGDKKRVRVTLAE